MALSMTEYDSKDTLNENFAIRIANILKQGISANGRASLVVSGGRTPKAMFAVLSQQKLPWQQVDITLADERWVDEDDAASNTAMVKRELLVNEASKATFFGLKTDHTDAADAVDSCNAQLSQIKTPFDVLILGMGEDGHTASLFPCSEQITEGLDLSNPSDYIAVTPTTAPNQRMSLTLQRLLKSEHIFLHLTGEAKKDVLEKANQGSEEVEMPIRAVFNNANVELVWAA